VAKKAHFIVVANRLPVRAIGEGEHRTWQISPGGLVTAITPILKERGGAWVGWTGQPDDAPDPFSHEGIHIHPVPISRNEIENFYEGFANSTLWPLYHDAVRRPEFHRRWWWPYVDVNRRFAEAVAQEAAPDASVWVHDYQLQLVPAMLREKRPDLRVGFFLHIPFPPVELLAQLPWRDQILEGLLGADLVGFQTKNGLRNFVRACQRYTDASGSQSQLQFGDRRVRLGAFPISIDVGAFEKKAADHAVRERSTQLRQTLGSWRKVILGVDRLDYTKGIEIRLKAFDDLLASGAKSVNDCVFVQVAVPSREGVEEYAELREEVEQIVGHINGRHGEAGMSAIHYLYRNLPFDELIAFYLAADVMMVTPLRDGMNLVAKEWVATRLDNTGSLMLSEFTGAARELTQALLVNPHDVDGLSATLEAALSLSEKEQKRRMIAMRRTVRKNDVFHWANAFLKALNER
jgi:trehalose 6-phosphate synthase